MFEAEKTNKYVKWDGSKGKDLASLCESGKRWLDNVGFLQPEGRNTIRGIEGCMIPDAEIEI